MMYDEIVRLLSEVKLIISSDVLFMLLFFEAQTYLFVCHKAWPLRNIAFFLTKR